MEIGPRNLSSWLKMEFIGSHLLCHHLHQHFHGLPVLVIFCSLVFLEMMEHGIKDVNEVEVEATVQMTEEEEGEEIEAEIVIEDRHHQIASEVS